MNSEKEPLAPPYHDSSTEGYYATQPIPNTYQSYDAHIQMPQPGFQQNTYPGNQPGDPSPNQGRPYAPDTAAYPTLPDITYPTLTLEQSQMMIETPVSCLKFLLWLFLTLLYSAIVIGAIVMIVLIYKTGVYAQMLPYIFFFLLAILLIFILIRLLAFQCGQRINVPIQSLNSTQLDNLPSEHQDIVAPPVEFVPLRTQGPPLLYFYMLIFYSILCSIMTVYITSILPKNKMLNLFVLIISVVSAVSGIFVAILAHTTHLPFIAPRIPPRVDIPIS